MKKGLLLLLLLTGCVSQQLKGFVGQPIHAVVIRNGPPSNVFDLPDGRRVFQWSMNRTFVMPTTAYNSGTAYPSGGSVNWYQQTTIAGGQAYTQRCVYSLYAMWYDSQNTWMVTSFEKPPYACE